jgi:hypothetical protein
VRIERRKVESAQELTTLVTEVLDGEIRGFRVIDHVEFPGDEIEIGMLAADADGRPLIVVSRDESGDGLILSYGRHVSWLRSKKEMLAKEHPEIDWSADPGIVMMAGGFSPYALVLASMLAVAPKICYSMKCLGIGTEKGLYVEPVEVPERTRPRETPVREGGLLSKAITGVVGIDENLSVSASFGYVSESLDWVPVANVRRRDKTVWVESGPGKWSTKKVGDESSLDAAMEKVRASYDEVLRTKGEVKDLEDSELSEAERKSLKWE